MKKRTRRRWMIAGAVVLVLIIAGLVGVAGCGEEESAGESVYYTGADDGDWQSYAVDEGMAYETEEALAPATDRVTSVDKNAGAIDVSESGFDQKIIKQGTLRIEVEKGGFDNAFDQAQLLATRYGGYIVSSSRYSSSSGDDGETYFSGTVTVNVPVKSFELAMSEGRKLGEVRIDETNSQDVTEEYVDLQASISNQQAYVDWLQAYLIKAKNINDVLTIRQMLTNEQRVLEQLKGRMQYLEGHTSYSTLTMSIYEAGGEVTPPDEEWGFVDSLKDALHNIVDAFSYVAKGLGWIIPVIIVVGILAGIAYAVVRATSRKKKADTKAEKGDSLGKTS